MDLILLFVVSILAGGVACVSGFGIGSLLTPLLALKVGMGVAIAGISIAHFLGTALRFWKWRKYVNQQVLWSFGVTSAAGGLLGAIVHNAFESVLLTVILGCLLIFAGVTGLIGLSDQWRLAGPMAWVAGALSGVFGGLVGNQGGIRTAAMFGFSLDKKTFVATATGIALAVDVARMPVYLVTQWREIVGIWPFIVVTAMGVIVGTEMGMWTLGKVPEQLFKKIVSGIVLLIGIFLLITR